jgi:hypothetical protein
MRSFFGGGGIKICVLLGRKHHAHTILSASSMATADASHANLGHLSMGQQIEATVGLALTQNAAIGVKESNHARHY